MGSNRDADRCVGQTRVHPAVQGTQPVLQLFPYLAFQPHTVAVHAGDTDAKEHVEGQGIDEVLDLCASNLSQSAFIVQFCRVCDEIY